MWAGCATQPDSSPAARQQAEADLVLNFQSWHSISFIKPDFAGTSGALTARAKTFSKAAVVKLLGNLMTPRGLVVVVLDRRHSPDPLVASGGMDEIQKFFEGLGFRRIIFQDGAASGRPDGLPVIRDTTFGRGPGAAKIAPTAGA